MISSLRILNYKILLRKTKIRIKPINKKQLMIFVLLTLIITLATSIHLIDVVYIRIGEYNHIVRRSNELFGDLRQLISPILQKYTLLDLLFVTNLGFLFLLPFFFK